MSINYWYHPREPLPEPADPAPHPFPGSAPTLSSVPAQNMVIGDLAEVTIAVGTGSPVTVVLLYDWRVQMHNDFAESTGHGDRFRTYKPLYTDWTVTAKGYVPVTGAVSYLAAYDYSNADPPALTFTGYAGPHLSSVPIFAGACYLMEGEISMPMAQAEQNITLRGTGTPTVGLGTAPP